jgi:hypothetical protein
VRPEEIFGQHNMLQALEDRPFSIWWSLLGLLLTDAFEKSRQVVAVL